MKKLTIYLILLFSLNILSKTDEISKAFKNEVKSGKSVIVTIKNKKKLFIEADYSILPTARFDNFLAKMANQISKLENEFERLEILYFNEQKPETKDRSKVIAGILIEYGVKKNKIGTAYPFLKIKKSIKKDSLLLIFRNVKNKKLIKLKMNEVIKNAGSLTSDKKNDKVSKEAGPEIEVLGDEIPLL